MKYPNLAQTFVASPLTATSVVATTLASTTLVATMLVATILLASSGQTFAAETLNVEQILIGPQAGDKPSNFSLKIMLHNSGPDLTDWKFGFYMPRNFRQTNQSNLKLLIQVCEIGSKNCSLLSYQRSKFLNNDLSSVFTTIVAPQKKFVLKHGKNYLFSFMHNSSRGPQNYSSLPQSLFIVTPNDVINLATNPNTYSVIDYDRGEAHQNIEQHLTKIWQNSNTQAAASVIIPEPSQVNVTDNAEGFKLAAPLIIHDLSNNSNRQTELWQQAIENDLAIKVKIDHETAESGILLKTVANNKISNPEGYQITINSQQIMINAVNPAGFFYALQSLRQLWYQRQSLASQTINDAPRFSYRGILLDVARHYYTLNQLQNFIDQMAALKLNTLHLHLSDDEAFRLNLPDFEELKQIGAKRGLGQLIGPMAFIQKNLSKSQSSDKLANADTIYSGSYSPDEIQQLISYANLHQITIIPEIDIPGHSRALMKAMPDSFYEANDLSSYPGYGDDALPVCAYDSNDKLGQNFSKSLTSILKQAAKLFSAQTTLYAQKNEISIGGDEVFKGTWDEAPSCQHGQWQGMNSLQKEHYFLEILSQDSRLSDLKFSGWQEFILSQNGQLNQQHHIDNQQVGHSWVWEKSSEALSYAVTLANANYPVVLDYADYLYFDMTYTSNFSEPGFYWGTKFGDTYAALNSAQAATKTQQQTKNPQQILGLEGALWGDVIPSYSQLEYMAFPKMTGLAEAAWSISANEEMPNWQSLAIRLGCGQSGFLAYLHDTYQTTYRGYPNGIKLEAPEACN